MNTVKTELLVIEGPLTGRRYTVPVTGLRLGRSSSCEISISDPALSRNQCLFELRGDVIWVTDLASANGTIVNDVQLGADSQELHAGDRVLVGESLISVVAEGEKPEDSAAGEQTVDLGLGKENPEEAAHNEKLQPKRLALWVAAALAVAGSAYVIMMPRKPVDTDVKPVANETPELISFDYEKVEASSKGIYRYYLTYGKGEMSVEIDDIQKEERHVRKSVKLSGEALERISAILSSKDLYQMDAGYAGVSVEEGALNSYTLRVLRGSQVFRTTLENAILPDVFKEVVSEIETFSKNELGIWAIQYSSDKLLSLSAQARQSADSKWEERDVQYGNTAAALKLYDEAVFYLETVNPKPAYYSELAASRQKAFDELEKRYRDQRFLADRAINLGDWSVARRELRILCEIVPDEKDQRHIDASAKLLDVEERMKKDR